MDGENQEYSTLEPVSDEGYSTLEPLSQQREDPGKQVIPEYDSRPALSDGRGELDTKNDKYLQEINGRRFPAQRFNKWKWILGGGVTGLVVILAAVLGGILGSRHKHSSRDTSNGPSNSSNESSSALPTQRNIAAVSFTSKHINNTRVYFQDKSGQIIEARNSADNTTWSTHKTRIRGKNESAIAAAVSRPGFPLEISLFYLNDNNIIQDIVYKSSNGNWTAGTLSTHAYTTMPNASLAAMYNQCKTCASTTIIAFQDKNGYVQIGNLTSDGWNLVQMGQALDPLLGTGLALQPFYRAGQVDEINLYHQKSTLNMSLAAWNSEALNGGVAGWGLAAQTYSRIPPGSPIAAASSYSSVSTGLETWIEVLSLSSAGVQVNTWSGAINNWLEYDRTPPAMANSRDSQKVYGRIAVTATGSAFAVAKQNGQADRIESWQVQDNMLDWISTGNVGLGDAWG